MSDFFNGWPEDGEPSSAAWSGRVTMARADWGDRDGSTVTFKLPMDETAEEQRNPFHAFTKRRKGRAGTRFMMACHTAREGIRHALYEDEVMLAGWNDSQTAGHTVKLWLCGDILGHPFDGIDRKEPLIVSLAELDDDQEIIDQRVRAKVEASRKRPSERHSYAAVMICKNEGFWTWINEQQSGPVSVHDEEGASIWLSMVLGIESRAELDKDERKAEAFHEKIRRPFLTWQGGY